MQHKAIDNKKIVIFTNEVEKLVSPRDFIHRPTNFKTYQCTSEEI